MDPLFWDHTVNVTPYLAPPFSDLEDAGLLGWSHVVIVQVAQLHIPLARATPYDLSACGSAPQGARYTTLPALQANRVALTDPRLWCQVP